MDPEIVCVLNADLWDLTIVSNIVYLFLFVVDDFDVVFIGDDWKGTERWNNFEKVLAKINVDVVYVPYTKGISTTEIREKIVGGDTI